MEIKPPSNNPHVAVTQNVSASTPTGLATATPAEWKVEQVLQAVITRMTDKQLFLDIQGIKANTAKPNISNLQIGDILKLQIEQLRPMPQFRVLGLHQSANADLVSNALRNVTTQETSLVPLLKNIHFVATRPAIRPAPLAVDVNAAVRDIFKQIPSPFNLKTAQQIKNQLQNSGIFIENKIKNQLFSALQSLQTKNALSTNTPLKTNLKPLLEQDLGAQLHRLANIIKTHIYPESNMTKSPQNPVKSDTQVTPRANAAVNQKAAAQQTSRAAEQASLQNISQREEAMQTFLRQVESSLTHLQHTQLQNLNESQAGRPLWLMELPIKDGQDIDLFELRISEEESNTEDEDKKIWNVTLQFDLAGLGKIKSHIKMQNEFISAQFYSEKAQTLALFQEHFDFLRGRLNYNGLNVGNLECTQRNLSDDKPPINTPRLDERI